MHRLLLVFFVVISCVGFGKAENIAPIINMPDPSDCELTLPVIQCLSTDEFGVVTITWIPSTDPNGVFMEYRIYSVQDGLLATITNISMSSFTVPTAVTQQNDYYISLVYDCNGTNIVQSDTVNNLFLDVTNPSDGTANLQWNTPIESPVSTMSTYYHIFREFPAGNWQLIDSVPYSVQFYKDTIDICDAFLRYQVVLENGSCSYTSNHDGDNFQDMLTPDIPHIQKVSIDTSSNKVVISWNQNYQSDTYGYVIYTYDANGFLFELDTLWGINNTTYLHNTDISQGPLSYSVAAFDSCLTESTPVTFQTSAKATINTSVYLESELQICNNLVSLNWSNYVGWDSVLYYEIWSQKDHSIWQRLDSTNGLSFSTSVESLKDYCFFVKAISLTGTQAFSNQSCLSVIAPTPASFHYLQLATVNEKQVDLKHLVDASGGVRSISFERMGKDGTFEEIAQIPVISNEVLYTDTDVEVDKHSYRYRTRIVDSCGQYGVVSNTAQTILLNHQKDEIEQVVYLNWNSYEQFNGGVLGFLIYRIIDDGFPELVATLPGEQLSYQDDLAELTFQGSACYFIEAVEGDNIYNAPQSSLSNRVCETFRPIIYVPNAFMPEGTNNHFLPVLSIIDPQDYRLTIYDRIGQIVFETDNPSIGWDGTIGTTGIKASAAAYIYRLQIHDGDGVEIVRRGHVTLIR